MASGNFVIGNDLSLEGFNTCVQPVLEEKGCAVSDKLVVNQRFHTAILTSISGGENLEDTVKSSLIDVKEKLEGEMREKGGREVSVYPHQVIGLGGGYFAEGVYQSDSTASELFPSIAQKYLLRDVGSSVGEVAEKIKSLLEQKLSDLAR